MAYAFENPFSWQEVSLIIYIAFYNNSIAGNKANQNNKTVG